MDGGSPYLPALAEIDECRKRIHYEFRFIRLRTAFSNRGIRNRRHSSLSLARYLDHMIIANETHLRGILQSYILYYNTQPTHLGVKKDSPDSRKVQTDGEIDKVAVANGLHHFYFRKAA